MAVYLTGFGLIFIGIINLFLSEKVYQNAALFLKTENLLYVAAFSVLSLILFTLNRYTKHVKVFYTSSLAIALFVLLLSFSKAETVNIMPRMFTLIYLVGYAAVMLKSVLTVEKGNNKIVVLITIIALAPFAAFII